MNLQDTECLNFQSRPRFKNPQSPSSPDWVTPSSIFTVHFAQSTVVLSLCSDGLLRCSTDFDMGHLYSERWTWIVQG